MSSRIQSLVVSVGIGLLLPAVVSAPLVVIVTVIAAMLLWIVKVSERKDNDLLLPIIGLAIGIVVAVLTAPLLGVPEAAVWILLFAVLM